MTVCASLCALKGGQGFKARLIKCALGKKNQSQMWPEWLAAPSLQALLSALWLLSPEGHLQLPSKSSRVKAKIKMNPWRGTLV